MAANDWTLADSPLPLQGFAPASAEGTWALLDSPLPIGQTFETPAAPWTLSYWTPPELAFNVQEPPPPPGGNVTRMLMGFVG